MIILTREKKETYEEETTACYPARKGEEGVRIRNDSQKQS